MKIGKLYIKLDENNTIQGYFKQFTEKPQHNQCFKIGCNFDEAKDFENSVIIDSLDENKIKIGISKIIDNHFIENPENI